MRKVHIFWQLVANFAAFQKNNRVFMQKNHVFKNYLPWEKFILRQLVANSADFWHNNNVCKEKIKKNQHLKNISFEENLYLKKLVV